MKQVDIMKKAAVIGRINGTVRQYKQDFSEPIPLKILSGKYARTLINLGGFYEVMRELEIDGSIRIERLRTGKTLVHSGDSVIDLRKAG